MRVKFDWQAGDAANEIGKQALGLANDLHEVEALLDFLPVDPKLQFGQAVAHAAMDAIAERKVLARALPVDDEFLGPVDHRFVAIARKIPHDDFVTLGDALSADLGVFQRGSTHVGERGLPADDFGNHIAD